MVDYDILGFILSSTYRIKVVAALRDGPMIPSEIAEETGKNIEHISRAIQELREENVVELLVDEDRQKGRFYGLTDEGREAVDGLGDRLQGR